MSMRNAELELAFLEARDKLKAELAAERAFHADTLDLLDRLQAAVLSETDTEGLTIDARTLLKTTEAQHRLAERKGRG